MEIRPIAHIHNDFPEKFGLPRQSGMAPHLISEIVMEEGYRQPDAFRGIENFTHLWLIWEFDPMGAASSGEDGRWSATVRPPKLGGNERVGVFATRSPNRPNRLGMTVVKLISYEVTDKGPVLKVAGADLKSGTAIYDIKPYVPFADCVPEASESLMKDAYGKVMKVSFPADLPAEISEERLEALKEILEYDPRPGYQDDPERIYAFDYGEYTVRFKAYGKEITVLDIKER